MQLPSIEWLAQKNPSITSTPFLVALALCPSSRLARTLARIPDFPFWAVSASSGILFYPCRQFNSLGSYGTTKLPRWHKLTIPGNLAFRVLACNRPTAQSQHYDTTTVTLFETFSTIHHLSSPMSPKLTTSSFLVISIQEWALTPPLLKESWESMSLRNCNSNGLLLLQACAEHGCLITNNSPPATGYHPCLLTQTIVISLIRFQAVLSAGLTTVSYCLSSTSVSNKETSSRKVKTPKHLNVTKLKLIDIKLYFVDPSDEYLESTALGNQDLESTWIVDCLGHSNKEGENGH